MNSWRASRSTCRREGRKVSRITDHRADAATARYGLLKNELAARLPNDIDRYVERSHEGGIASSSSPRSGSGRPAYSGTPAPCVRPSLLQGIAYCEAAA